MKVLITGARGFIGCSLLEHLNGKGYDVVGWDILSGEHIEHVNMLNIEEIINGLKKEKPDCIVHCAGMADVSMSLENPQKDFSKNVEITHNFLFSIKKSGLINCKFIFLSSAAVYGNPNKLPICETDERNPMSPYALHKLMCEEICEYFFNNKLLNIKILRIFSAYGEGLKKQIFWDMYNRYNEQDKLEMFGTGHESRDYIYIRDLLNAIEIVMKYAPKDELVYNVGNGVEESIQNVANCFADAMGFSRDKIEFTGKKREGNPENWRADINRLEELGYRRQYSFEEGILNYVNWLNGENND